MQAATKVVFNTVILYAKILISMAISLVSVPLVLKALGASDYGLYNLIAGIVAMLAFLNNSMTVSSQRYMSVAMGEGNVSKINSIYNASFILHLILAISIAIALEIIGLPSIGKLNIAPERLWCAKIIFHFLVLSMFSKVIAVPFDALMNAHEDMLAFSVIELIDSLIMLSIALVLQFVSSDKLVFYGVAVSSIAVLTLLMKWGWCRHAYKSFRLNLKGKANKPLIKEMLGFTSWNLFGGLAMMGRNQGVAVIFNLFLGTIANAAYGIANQINGALSHFSSTFQRAINPQLMKSEGMGNRARLQKISIISSKFSVLALCLFAVPLIIEMDDVLQIWLQGNIPDSTLELSRCILILSIIYQFSSGLMSSIQATGQIKNYTITMGLLILTNIPIAYILLKLEYPIHYVTIGFIVIEMISLITRINMAKKLTGLMPREYFNKVVSPVFIIIIVSVMACLAPYLFVRNIYARLLSVCFIYGITYLIMMWFLGLDKEHRQLILARLK